MKDFESGVTYLRKEALKYGLVKESDNDGVLIERLARIIRGADPFDGDAELAEESEAVREAALDAHAEKLIAKIDENDESGSDQKSE